MSIQADITFERELWETAVTLRGTVAPGDYKHYVLPLLFLRYLSLGYEQRHQQLELMLKDQRSEYFTGDPTVDQEILEDPVEYDAANVFVVPEEASWDTLRRHARADDIKLRVDNAMRLLEERHPALQGVLPRIYANSNLEVDQVAGLITLFSKDIFAQRNGADLLGRTYEYFISNFASTEGTRGGEFFTPSSIVRLLVEMLEPTTGRIMDPACGSGGMFVQSARFTDSAQSLSFFGQERIETTWRLCQMNLILHGIRGKIEIGNSLLNDRHPSLKADKVPISELLNRRVLFIGDGYRAKNVEFGSTGLPFARVGNIGAKGELDLQGVDMFPEKDLHKVGNKISQPGDIAFTSKGTVGRFIFVKENMQRFVYSPQISFWRVLDCTEIEPRFYYFGCVEGNLANRFTV